ncbi:MAG: hypothetical protein E6Q50_04985 [Lysobacter sp.]|nr:MAG: hypothetical protein E6Q50_04985 [Lysobacter sp.]
MRVVVTLIVALLASVSARAAEPTFAPGDYIAEGGWGRLTVAAPKDGQRAFSLFALGANAHMCEVEGQIANGRATLATYADEPDCVVDFAPTAQGIAVEAGESCRYFCGARAWFVGEYLAVAPGCDDASRAKTRNAFKQEYDRKRYDRAYALLSPLPERCAKTLHWLERGELLNDVAITQYKRGDRAGCLRTLEPLAKDAATPDDKIEIDGWLAERHAYQPILDATRFNLRLCRKPAR